jgi:hypothetical protein
MSKGSRHDTSSLDGGDCRFVADGKVAASKKSSR